MCKFAQNSPALRFWLSQPMLGNIHTLIPQSPAWLKNWCTWKIMQTWRSPWWSPRIAQADRLLKHPRNNVVLVPSRKSSCTSRTFKMKVTFLEIFIYFTFPIYILVSDQFFFAKWRGWKPDHPHNALTKSIFTLFPYLYNV